MGNRGCTAGGPSPDHQSWLVVDDGRAETIRFDPRDSQAICIGIGEQTRLNHGHLGAAADNDATALAALLLERYRFPKNHVHVFHSGGRHATKRRILESLRRCARHTKPRGLLLVQFACHVIQIPRGRHGEQAFLVPADYNSHWKTAISADEIAQAVEGSSAGHVVLVVDCCHAGHLATDLVIKTSVPTWVMASCTSSQRSVSFRELGHGFFTFFLIRFLRDDLAASPETNSSASENLVATQETRSSASHNLVASQGTDSSVSENVVASQGTDSSVSENLVASQGTDSPASESLASNPRGQASRENQVDGSETSLVNSQVQVVENAVHLDADNDNGTTNSHLAEETLTTGAEAEIPEGNEYVGPEFRDFAAGRRRSDGDKKGSPFRKGGSWKTPVVAGSLLAEGQLVTWPVTSAVDYCKPLCQAVVSLISPTFGGGMRMDPMVVRNTWSAPRDYDVTDFAPDAGIDYVQKYVKWYRHQKVEPVWLEVLPWLNDVTRVSVSTLARAGYLISEEDDPLYATVVAFTTQSCLRLLHDHCKRHNLLNNLYKPLCYLELYQCMVREAFSLGELLIRPDIKHLAYSLQHYIIMLRDLSRVTLHDGCLADLMYLMTSLLFDCDVIHQPADVTDGGPGNFEETIEILQQLPTSHQTLPPPALDQTTPDSSPDGSPSRSPRTGTHRSGKILDSSPDGSPTRGPSGTRQSGKMHARDGQTFLDGRLDEQALLNKIGGNLRLE